MRKALFLLILFCSPHAVAQGIDSAQKLEAACKLVDTATNFEEAAEARHCLGYVAGVADGIGMIQAFIAILMNEKQRDVPFGPCFPEGGISSDQTRRIFLKYLADNPDQLHEAARSTVFVALTKTFPPCADKQ